MSFLRQLRDRIGQSDFVPAASSVLSILLVLFGLGLCVGVAHVQHSYDMYVSARTEVSRQALQLRVALLLVGMGIGVLPIVLLLRSLSARIRSLSALSPQLAQLHSEAQELQVEVLEGKRRGGQVLSLTEQHFDSLQKAVHAVRAQADLAASNIEEISVSIAQLVDSAEEAQRLTHDSLSEAGRGQQVVAEAGREIQSVADNFNQTVETIRSLHQRGSEIGGLVSLIKDIADQTKVLSLNAGIEAARAGKEGRGFAVVAEEVRRLAERTAQSTRQVAKIVDGIQRETMSAVSSMQRAQKQVEVGRDLSHEAEQALSRIHSGASQSMATVEQIASATRELKGASLQIAGYLGSLAVGTRKAAKTAQRATKEILAELSLLRDGKAPTRTTVDPATESIEIAPGKS